MRSSQKYTPTKKDVMTDDILKKGHAHKPKVSEPDICPYCSGLGTIYDMECEACQGTGEIYE